MNKKTISPAYLWIGNHDVLLEKVIAFLQNTLCKNKGNDHCTTCQHIVQQQHHAVIWLAPEKQYALKQLEPITQRISFELAPGQHCFFIVQNADFLTPACANSLLKSVEEPPAGYHFIFLAERIERILPTIRSRCIIQSFIESSHQENHHPLFSFFTCKNPDPIAFDKQLLISKINERESAELLDDLLNYWLQQYKKITIEQEQDKQNKTLKKKYKETTRMIKILKTAFKKPPMPGSGKIFWRNCFLQMTTRS